MRDVTNYINRGFNERKFWIWAFVLYAMAETLYWILNYWNISTKCNGCTQPVYYYLVQWLLYLVLTAVVWYFLNSFYKEKRIVIISLNVIVFIFHFAGWIWINYILQHFGPEWLTGYLYRKNSIHELMYYSWFDISKYVLKITAFYLMKFYSEYRRSEQQRIQLAMVNKDLQLNLLKQQLSPHFYFNTLNNLYGLARSNNSKLSRALQQLSNIMHYVIVECNQPKVSLQKEIDFLQSYIELEKLRYEENTIIDMQVEGKANGQTILPLMLIQFVENAFKHGMKEKSEQNWMRVNMRIRNSDLLFSVNNSYYPTRPAEGIGLASVKHHLNLQYEGKYDMKMDMTDGKFSVTLQLNLS
jgi:sensor histidine kinase YesM